MNIHFKLNIWEITILAVVVTGLTLSNLIANITISKMQKGSVENPVLLKSNRYEKKQAKILSPIINKNDNETANVLKNLAIANVIQYVLEETIKANDDIALMAVYAEDGTILAHLKPERIGKNMYDVDVELGDCIKEMHKAMKHRRIYNGFKFDPLLNERIRFIVKPLQISNLKQNLSLLVGVR